MAALRVGTELDFVNGQKRDGDVDRHRFDGADIEAWELGDDALLAGD
jgi:hypothetical protein